MHFPFLSLGVSGAGLALTIALAGLGSGVIFGALGMYFQHRRQAMWHETAKLALEKGQPLPPPLDVPLDSWHANAGGLAGATAEIRVAALEQIRAGRIRGYLLGGLINLAVSAGLFVALWHLSPATAYFAAIPGFIGLALVLVAVFELLTGPKPRT